MKFEPRTPDPLRLIAHSCVTYPGTSGTPLVIGTGAEAVLVAIHIGTQLQFDGRELDFVSDARPVDAAIVAAVDAAVVAAAAATGRRRARR